MNEWQKIDLQGDWLVTYKLDGVRALSNGTTVLSRNQKPLYGLATLAHTFRDAEIYCGSFKETIQVVRTHHGRAVRPEEIYDLLLPDPRLIVKHISNPTVNDITQLLEFVLQKGYEGLVLRQGDAWLKVVPYSTYDVKVTGVVEGKGRNKGRIGALITDMGKVGILTDQERQESNWIGQTIEVVCKHLTAAGKFRQPRLKRVRFDK